MIGQEIAGLAIDGVLIALLAAVLWACWRVNTRLGEIRGGQAELADLAMRLESLTGKAREALAELRAGSEAAETGLKGEIRRARALADELTLITEAGDNLASRLEHKLAPDREKPAAGGERRGGAVLHALREAR